MKYDFFMIPRNNELLTIKLRFAININNLISYRKYLAGNFDPHELNKLNNKKTPVVIIRW